MHVTHAIVLALGLTACSSGSFSGGGGKTGGKAATGPTDAARPQDGDGDDGGKDDADLGDDVDRHDGADALDGTPATTEFEARCPTKTQTVLILDLKSGWWSGDGGMFFEQMLGGLTGKCQDKLTLEYHHLLEGDDETATYPGGRFLEPNEPGRFGKASFDDYAQIWVLSGSAEDGADIDVRSPVWTAVAGKIVAAKGSLMIAAGNGSNTHANDVAGRLGLGAPFATQNEEGVVLSPTDTVVVKSRITKDALASHPIFAGVDAIADGLVMLGDDVRSDYLGQPGGAKILAKNDKGQPAIAETSASGRKVLLEAGIQRYYAIGVDGGTRRLIQNILVYLGE